MSQNLCIRYYTSVLMILSSVFIGIAGCHPGESQNSEHESQTQEALPIVIALNYPLANTAYQLAGQWIEIQCPVPEERDPAFWTPNDSQISALQQADLVLLNGAGHEPWRDRVTLSPLNVTITARGFRNQWIAQQEATTHQHGPEGEHTHTGFASTTWLDPVLFQEQVYVLGHSLIKLLPEKREEISHRLTKFKQELGELDQQWKTATKLLGTRTLIASHPVYQYLAKRYGWKLQSLHWEPNQSLSEKDWEQFDRIRKENHADFMLWEADPIVETAEELKKRNMKIIVLKPLGNGPLKETVLEKMQANVQRFQAALTQK